MVLCDVYNRSEIDDFLDIFCRSLAGQNSDGHGFPGSFLKDMIKGKRVLLQVFAVHAREALNIQ